MNYVIRTCGLIPLGGVLLLAHYSKQHLLFFPHVVFYALAIIGALLVSYKVKPTTLAYVVGGGSVIVTAWMINIV